MAHIDYIVQFMDYIAVMSAPSKWPLPDAGIRFLTPSFMVEKLARHPLTKDCYPTAMGYYPAAAGHRMRFGFRKTFRGVLGGQYDAFILKEREVPEELKEWLDERDLFDSTEVDRITGIWKDVLS